MKEKFEYAKAIEELEAIAAKVEDPQTGIEELEAIAAKVEDPQGGIDDVDRYIKRSEELIDACRAYLRGAREMLDA